MRSLIKLIGLLFFWGRCIKLFPHGQVAEVMALAAEVAQLEVDYYDQKAETIVEAATNKRVAAQKIKVKLDIVSLAADAKKILALLIASSLGLKFAL